MNLIFFATDVQKRVLR